MVKNGAACITCGILLLVAFTVQGRPQHLMTIPSKASDPGHSPRSGVSAAKSSIRATNGFSSSFFVGVKCQCPSGCSGVGIYFTLWENRSEGYCDEPYQQKYVKGSRCARACGDLGYNETCSVESADPSSLCRIKGKEYNSSWYNEAPSTSFHILTCRGADVPSSHIEGSDDISYQYESEQKNDTALGQEERGVALSKVACTAYKGYCYLATTSKCEFKCPWWKIWCTQCKDSQIKEKKCSGTWHTLAKWGCNAVSWKGIADVVKDVIWEWWW